MSIAFKKRATASVPTPDAGSVALFVETATGIPHIKDETGTAVSLEGAPGAAGAAGAPGATGPAGSSLLNGSGAPSGGLGANGDFYLDTAASAVYGPKAAGAWGSPTSLVGPTGAAGAAGATGTTGATGPAGATGAAGAAGATGAAGVDGKTVRSGSGAPAGGLGVDGDFYLDTATSGLYGPKTAGAWGSPTSLIGPAGPTGSAGAAGATGSTGAPGSTGSTGATGAPGADGAVWRDGSGVPSNGLGVNGDYYLDSATGNVYLRSAGTYSVVANIKGATGAAGATGSTGAAGAAGSTGAAGPPGLSWKNKLINGGIEVWQRQVTFAIAASSFAYGPDRWVLTTGANEAGTITQVAGLTATSRYAAKVQRNSGQTGTVQMQFEQPFALPNIADVRGKLLAISFTAKAGANWSPASGTLGCAIIVGTGAAARRGGTTYTSETAPVVGSANLTTTATRYTITTATVIPTTSTQLTLIFYWSPVGTAGADDSFTVDDVQLETAAAATDFEDPPFDMILFRCRRYRQQSYPYGIYPGDTGGNYGSVISKVAYDTANCWWGTQFPVRMRTTPTVILYGPASGVAAQVRKSSDGAVITATVAVNYISESGFTDFVKTSAFVTGAYYDCHYVAECEL